MKKKIFIFAVVILLLAFITASLISVFVLFGHKHDECDIECVFCTLCEDLSRIRSLFDTQLICYGMMVSLCFVFITKSSVEVLGTTLIQLKVKLSD